MRRYAENLAPSSVFRSLMEVPRPRVLALLVPLPQRVPLGREPAEFPRLEGVVDVGQAGVGERREVPQQHLLQGAVDPGESLGV